MAYSEELDLIQNVKNLSDEVADALKRVNDSSTSFNEIKDLKEKFDNLKTATLDVIDQYSNELSTKSKALSDLLTSTRSQFNQVTDDVEALVNLEVDFTIIKDKIEQSLAINAKLTDLVSNGVILMTSNNYVDVQDRKPYKQYLNVLSTVET